MSFPRRRARGLGAAAATAVAASAALAAPALAAPSGSTTIDLKGPAAKALSGQQVKLSAKKPAKAGAKKIVLPVRGATVDAKGAKLTHGGSVTLRRKAGGRTRTVTLTAWQTQIAAKRSTISAKLGGKRVALFTATAPQRRVTLNAGSGTATVTGATVRLTPAGAKALRAKLALTRLPAVQIGGGRVVGKTGAGSGGSGGSGGGNGGGGGGSGGGGGGGTAPTPGGPVVDPITNEPPLLARPATAVDVTSARLTWWVRDSWIAYVYSGNDAAPWGTTFSQGATAGAAILARDHICKDDPKREAPALPYSFDFPFSNGWYDAGSRTAGLYHTGQVAFRYASHGIDVTATNPEVELNGAASRLIFRLGGSGNTRLGDKRGVLTSLARATPTVSPDGKTITYPPIKGTLGAESANTFAGFYAEGAGYGCTQVSFTIG